MCYKIEKDILEIGILSGQPVVVITTIDENGVRNAAAFGSYFRLGKSVIIAMHKKSHTCQNILKTGEFVMNIPGFKDFESIMMVSRDYSGKQDEIAGAGLSEEKSSKVAPPTITEYPASVECRMKWSKDEGEEVILSAEMICGKCDESYMDMKGKFDQVKAGILHIVRFPEPLYIKADRYVQGIETMT